MKYLAQFLSIFLSVALIGEPVSVFIPDRNDCLAPVTGLHTGALNLAEAEELSRTLHPRDPNSIELSDLIALFYRVSPQRMYEALVRKRTHTLPAADAELKRMWENVIQTVSQDVSNNLTLELISNAVDAYHPDDTIGLFGVGLCSAFRLLQQDGDSLTLVTSTYGQPDSQKIVEVEAGPRHLLVRDRGIGISQSILIGKVPIPKVSGKRDLTAEEKDEEHSEPPSAHQMTFFKKEGRLHVSLEAIPNPGWRGTNARINLANRNAQNLKEDPFSVEEALDLVQFLNPEKAKIKVTGRPAPQIMNEETWNPATHDVFTFHDADGEPVQVVLSKASVKEKSPVELKGQAYAVKMGVVFPGHTCEYSGYASPAEVRLHLPKKAKNEMERRYLEVNETLRRYLNLVSENLDKIGLRGASALFPLYKNFQAYNDSPLSKNDNVVEAFLIHFRQLLLKESGARELKDVKILPDIEEFHAVKSSDIFFLNPDLFSALKNETNLDWPTPLFEFEPAGGKGLYLADLGKNGPVMAKTPDFVLLNSHTIQPDGNSDLTKILFSAFFATNTVAVSGRWLNQKEAREKKEIWQRRRSASETPFQFEEAPITDESRAERVLVEKLLELWEKEMAAKGLAVSFEARDLEGMLGRLQTKAHEILSGQHPLSRLRELLLGDKPKKAKAGQEKPWVEKLAAKKEEELASALAKISQEAPPPKPKVKQRKIAIQDLGRVGKKGVGKVEYSKPKGVLLPSKINPFIEIMDGEKKLIYKFSDEDEEDWRSNSSESYRLAELSGLPQDYSSNTCRLYRKIGFIEIEFSDQKEPPQMLDGISQPLDILIDPNHYDLWILHSGETPLARFELDRNQAFNDDCGRVRYKWKKVADVGAFEYSETDVISPMAMALSEDGRIWLTDSEQNRVVVLKPDGSYDFHFGKTGSGKGEFCFTSDEDDDPEGAGIQVNQSLGIVAVADTANRRLQFFDLKGNYLGERTHNDPDGPMLYPHSLSLAEDGTLLYSDRDAGYVGQLNLQVVEEEVDDPKPPPANIGKSSKSEEPYELIPFSLDKEITAKEIFVAQDGTLYFISQPRDSIDQFSPDGNHLRTLSKGEEWTFKDVNEIKQDSEGNFYVSTKKTLFKFNSEWGLVWKEEYKNLCHFDLDPDGNVYLIYSEGLTIEDTDYLVKIDKNGMQLNQVNVDDKNVYSIFTKLMYVDSEIIIIDDNYTLAKIFDQNLNFIKSLSLESKAGSFVNPKGGFFISDIGLLIAYSKSDPVNPTTYREEKIIQLQNFGDDDCIQGVIKCKNYFVIPGNRGIYVYDSQWKLVQFISVKKDSNIYAISLSNLTKNGLFVLNPTEKKVFKLQLKEEKAKTSPAFSLVPLTPENAVPGVTMFHAQDGTLYVADRGGNALRQYDKEGHLLRMVSDSFTEPLERPVKILQAPDGSFYVVCERALLKFGPNWNLQWKVSLNYIEILKDSRLDAHIHPNGHIYLLDIFEDQKYGSYLLIRCFNAEGHEIKRRREMGMRVSGFKIDRISGSIVQFIQENTHEDEVTKIAIEIPDSKGQALTTNMNLCNLRYFEAVQLPNEEWVCIGDSDDEVIYRFNAELDEDSMEMIIGSEKGDIDFKKVYEIVPIGNQIFILDGNGIHIYDSQWNFLQWIEEYPDGVELDAAEVDILEMDGKICVFSVEKGQLFSLEVDQPAEPTAESIRGQFHPAHVVAADPLQIVHAIFAQDGTIYTIQFDEPFEMKELDEGKPLLKGHLRHYDREGKLLGEISKGKGWELKNPAIIFQSHEGDFYIYDCDSNSILHFNSNWEFVNEAFNSSRHEVVENIVQARNGDFYIRARKLLYDKKIHSEEDRDVILHFDSKWNLQHQRPCEKGEDNRYLAPVLSENGDELLVEELGANAILVLDLNLNVKNNIHGNKIHPQYFKTKNGSYITLECLSGPNIPENLWGVHLYDRNGKHQGAVKDANGQNLLFEEYSLFYVSDEFYLIQQSELIDTPSTLFIYNKKWELVQKITGVKLIAFFQSKKLLVGNKEGRLFIYEFKSADSEKNEVSPVEEKSSLPIGEKLAHPIHDLILLRSVEHGLLGKVLALEEVPHPVNLTPIFSDPAKLDFLKFLLERFGITPESRKAFWQLAGILSGGEGPPLDFPEELKNAVLALFQRLDTLHSESIAPEHLVEIAKAFWQTYHAQKTAEEKHNFLTRGITLVEEILKEDFKKEKSIRLHLDLVEILMEFFKSQEVMKGLIHNGEEAGALKRLLLLLQRASDREAVRDAFEGAISFLDSKVISLLSLASSLDATDKGKEMARWVKIIKKMNELYRKEVIASEAKQSTVEIASGPSGPRNDSKRRIPPLGFVVAMRHILQQRNREELVTALEELQTLDEKKVPDSIQMYVIGLVELANRGEEEFDSEEIFVVNEGSAKVRDRFQALSRKLGRRKKSKAIFTRKLSEHIMGFYAALAEGDPKKYLDLDLSEKNLKEILKEKRKADLGVEPTPAELDESYAALKKAADGAIFTAVNYQNTVPVSFSAELIQNSRDAVKNVLYRFVNKALAEAKINIDWADPAFQEFVGNPENLKSIEENILREFGLKEDPQARLKMEELLELPPQGKLTQPKLLHLIQETAAGYYLLELYEKDHGPLVEDSPELPVFLESQREKVKKRFGTKETPSVETLKRALNKVVLLVTIERIPGTSTLFQRFTDGGGMNESTAVFDVPIPGYTHKRRDSLKNQGRFGQGLLRALKEGRDFYVRTSLGNGNEVLIRFQPLKNERGEVYDAELTHIFNEAAEDDFKGTAMEWHEADLDIPALFRSAFYRSRILAYGGMVSESDIAIRVNGKNIHRRGKVAEGTRGKKAELATTEGIIRIMEYEGNVEAVTHDGLLVNYLKLDDSLLAHIDPALRQYVFQGKTITVPLRTHVTQSRMVAGSDAVKVALARYAIEKVLWEYLDGRGYFLQKWLSEDLFAGRQGTYLGIGETDAEEAAELLQIKRDGAALSEGKAIDFARYLMDSQNPSAKQIHYRRLKGLLMMYPLVPIGSKKYSLAEINHCVTTLSDRAQESGKESDIKKFRKFMEKIPEKLRRTIAGTRLFRGKGTLGVGGKEKKGNIFEELFRQEREIRKEAEVKKKVEMTREERIANLRDTFFKLKPLKPEQKGGVLYAYEAYLQGVIKLVLKLLNRPSPAASILYQYESPWIRAKAFQGGRTYIVNLNSDITPSSLAILKKILAKKAYQGENVSEELKEEFVEALGREIGTIAHEIFHMEEKRGAETHDEVSEKDLETHVVALIKNRAQVAQLFDKLFGSRSPFTTDAFEDMLHYLDRGILMETFCSDWEPQSDRLPAIRNLCPGLNSIEESL